MDIITLEVQSRDVKISPKYLRQNRKIPAVVYGEKEKSLVLQVDYQSFRKVYDKAGGNQVIELQVDGKKKPVLIHEVQYDPLTDKFTHIDFLQINMNKEVTAHVPVQFTGVAPAVKDLGGILTTLKHELEVRCLPADLPQVILVDISGLALLHSSVHVNDITLPNGVKPVSTVNDVIVTVAPAKLQEEAAAEAAASAAAAPAAVSAEGAAPAAAEGAAAPGAAPSAPAKKE